MMDFQGKKRIGCKKAEIKFPKLTPYNREMKSIYLSTPEDFAVD